MNDLLTARELAEVLRMNWQTVLKWKREGRITAEVDLPRKVLFDEARVRRQLAKLNRRKVVPALKEIPAGAMVPTY